MLSAVSFATVVLFSSLNSDPERAGSFIFSRRLLFQYVLLQIYDTLSAEWTSSALETSLLLRGCVFLKVFCLLFSAAVAYLAALLFF